MRNISGLCAGILSLATAAALSAAQPAFTSLYNFGNTPADGIRPGSAPALGAGGVLYGTTAGGGGPLNEGTVYSLTPPTSPGGSWTESVLYVFTGGVDGFAPVAGVIVGPDGVLYGTVANGGMSSVGAVYSLTPPESLGGSWTFALLYSFTGTDGDGVNPAFSLTLGSGGVLYGVTSAGGSTNDGTVYSLAPPEVPGGAWTYTLLYSFSGPDGQSPNSPVVIGAGGELYGVTMHGGNGSFSRCNNRHDFGCGLVYSLTPAGDGSWTEATLYEFLGSSDGQWPGDLIMDASGTLYGAMYGGVYALAPPLSPGGTWTGTKVQNFPGIADLAPLGLCMAPNGVIYGLTYETTNNGGGILFSLTPPAAPGGAWTKRTLWQFSPFNVPDGGTSPVGLILTTNGAGKVLLYGATSAGPNGMQDYGMVFSLKP